MVLPLPCPAPGPLPCLWAPACPWAPAVPLGPCRAPGFPRYRQRYGAGSMSPSVSPKQRYGAGSMSPFVLRITGAQQSIRSSSINKELNMIKSAAHGAGSMSPCVTRGYRQRYGAAEAAFDLRVYGLGILNRGTSGVRVRLTAQCASDAYG